MCVTEAVEIPGVYLYVIYLLPGACAILPQIFRGCCGQIR